MTRAKTVVKTEIGAFLSQYLRWLVGARISLLNRSTYQIGPGRRSVLTLHRKIEADWNRDTPGAARMRAVVRQRAMNWR